MYNETVDRLEAFTDASEFERLSCDLLSRLGYRGIEPQGVGKKDGGKDALYFADGKKTVIHISLRKDWTKKIDEDLETTVDSKGKYDKFVFVSNRSISPKKRDKIKEKIRSQYGWEPVIIEQETLRVELDNHALDLREKYLKISTDYKSEVDSIIDDFIDERDEFSNYAIKTSYQRILLLAIPVKMHDNMMKLFDDKMKFVGDKEKLKETLGQNLPSNQFDSKITSNSFSTYLIEKEPPSFFSLGCEYIHESNLYNNGIVEIMHDASRYRLDSELVNSMIQLFFDTFVKLYTGIIQTNDFVKIVVCFINAEEMDFKKEDGKKYSGEKHYLVHDEEEKMVEISKKQFQDDFIEVMDNKINNFFNN